MQIWNILSFLHSLLVILSFLDSLLVIFVRLEKTVTEVFSYLTSKIMEGSLEDVIWWVLLTNLLIQCVGDGGSKLSITIQARIAQLVAYQLGTGEVRGSNPSKDDNFSVKISDWIVQIWIRIYNSNMYSALWYIWSLPLKLGSCSVLIWLLPCDIVYLYSLLIYVSIHICM